MKLTPADGPSARITVLVPETERRAIVEEAAARSIESGRPVSLSEVLRDAWRTSHETGRDGCAA
jgi:hypothetical protein